MRDLSAEKKRSESFPPSSSPNDSPVSNQPKGSFPIHTVTSPSRGFRHRLQFQASTRGRIESRERGREVSSHEQKERVLVGLVVRQNTRLIRRRHGVEDDEDDAIEARARELGFHDTVDGLRGFVQERGGERFCEWRPGLSGLELGEIEGVDYADPDGGVAGPAVWAVVDAFDEGVQDLEVGDEVSFLGPARLREL